MTTNPTKTDLVHQLDLIVEALADNKQSQAGANAMKFIQMARMEEINGATALVQFIHDCGVA